MQKIKREEVIEVEFDYFYNRDGDRFSYYMLPKIIVTDERFKNLGRGSYFKELLDRLRDIRSSEKVFYRQVLDLFETSVDYNSKSNEAKCFFATVQNKMHFAIHNK